MSGFVASSHANKRSCRLRSELMFHEAMRMRVAVFLTVAPILLPTKSVSALKAPLQLQLSSRHGHDYLRTRKLV